MIEKLTLGTAQFGLDYGIDNPKGRISKKTIQTILDTAHDSGVDMLDTAFAYGESEAVLGGYLSARGRKGDFRIVSKMAPSQNSKTAIDDTLGRLGCDTLYGYLLHDFTGTRAGDLSQYDAMRAAVDSGKARKGGFSVYYPSDLQYALDQGLTFEIVQLPFSVLDRRFEEILPVLHAKGVEIHVRSIYLQGLVFLDDRRLIGSFEPARASVRCLRSLSMEQQRSIADLCLRFVLSVPYVDRVVVGVNGVENVKGNIESCRAGVLQDAGWIQVLDALGIEDETVLLPFLWRHEG